MYADNALILTSVLLGLFCVVGWGEHALYGGFNRVYYTHGVPFVSLRIPVAAPAADMPPVAPLQEQVGSALIGSLALLLVARDTYGFRRQFFPSALFPGHLVHGMLRFDRDQRRVLLQGFINAWILLLLLVVVVFSIVGPISLLARVLTLGIVTAAIGVPLLLERQRCMKLARLAASAWETAC